MSLGSQGRKAERKEDMKEQRKVQRANDKRIWDRKEMKGTEPLFLLASCF